MSLLTAVFVGVLPSLSGAQETGRPIEIHGFVSPGFVYTTHGHDYLARTSERGSFEFTEVGVNFTKPITDQLHVGVQLFTRDLGETGDYTAKLDWFHLDYRYRDWLGIRAGRVKIPFGLYNDVSDIDVARVPVLLPQSVYPAGNRDFLLAQTGGELYGRYRIGPVGALAYRVYGGTIFIDTPSPEAGSPVQLGEVRVPYVYGGRLLWETPLDGLRMGGAIQSLRLDTTVFLDGPPPPGTFATVKIPALLWVGSIEYAAHDLLVAAEYSRWAVEVQSTDPAVFPESNSEQERGYVMASYRIGDWLQPGAYYALHYPDAEVRSGAANRQHDVAATLRFDVTPNWLVKLEGHYMNGTVAGTSRDGTPPMEWGVFLVKTTAHF